MPDRSPKAITGKGFTQRPQRDEERKESFFAAFLLFAAFA